MRHLYLLLTILLLLGVTQIGFSQTKKRNKNIKKQQTVKSFKGDFKEIKVPHKMWIPSDSSLLNIKLNKIEAGVSDLALQDTLVETNAIGTGGSPFAAHFTSPSFDYRAKPSKRKNVLNPNPAPFADTININRLYHQEGAFTGIDLTITKSLLREDTTDLYDVSDDEMVEVSEELAIDCVWVKLTGYYAVWNSDNINPYKVDIEKFKDSVNLLLFDVAKDFRWSPPLVSNRVTSNFGARWRRWHHGVDLDLEIGDSILSSFDGIVRIAKYEKYGYGNFVVLRHYNGLETLYGHMSKSLVEIGDHVKAGELIGYGGNTGRSTGPHLHYEIRYQGYALDPRLIYDFENNRILSNTFAITPDLFGHLTKHRQTIWHRVKKGETLSRIASRYRVPTNQLFSLNRLNKSAILKAGQRIRVR
jgi:hypothetical protein